MKLLNFLKCGVVVAMLASSASAQLVNGGFDAQDTSGGDISANAGITGWTALGDPNTLFISSQTGTPADTDANIMKVFGFDGGGAFLGQDFAAAAGQTWVATGVGRLPSADPIPTASPDRGFLEIQFLTAGGLLVGDGGGLADGTQALGFNSFQSNTLDPSSSQFDTWIALGAGTAAAPTGTAFARLIVGKTNGGFNGGSMFFDSVTFNQSAIPEPGSLAVIGLGALGFISRRRRS